MKENKRPIAKLTDLGQTREIDLSKDGEYHTLVRWYLARWKAARGVPKNFSIAELLRRKKHMEQIRARAAQRKKR